MLRARERFHKELDLALWFLENAALRTKAPLLLLLLAGAPSLSSCGASSGSDPDAGPSQPDAAIPIDVDGDGFSPPQDCDDTDPNVNPSAAENCEDGIDNDCDGSADTDRECLSACELAVLDNSYLGCGFYALDLPQISLNKIYAISVSNPSLSETATVIISGPGGVLETLSVLPLEVGTYEVSDRASMNISVGGVTNQVYRIDSDQPIAAYQFNSFDTIGAASTDASLLFADHTLGSDYFAMTYDVAGIGADRSFVSIVATEDDTVVNVDATSTTMDATQATLAKGEVMTVISSIVGESLTGSQISANNPIAVFAGNRCTQVPTGTAYCDHVEQQMFPRQAIGDNYIIGKTSPRQSCDLPDYVRILADVDNTTVTLTPASGGPYTLQAGEHVELALTEPVALQASGPVLVGSFMASSQGGSCNDEGDPAFTLQVPSDQFRNQYVFLTPPTYTRDFVDVIAPMGANVVLDDQVQVLSTVAIGGTDFTLTSILIDDGTHVLQSSEPVGILVYGYGGPSGSPDGVVNVSYAYPGGLDLAPINPID